MKRIVTAGLSALILAGSFASAASAQDFGRYDRRGDRDGRGDWNRGDDRRDYDRRDYDRGRFERGRFDHRFDRDWRRGDRLPYGWERHYSGVDYRYERLRPPPYGYRYVRDDSGRILLVGLATGVILSAILSNY
ncbi:MAG: RcnB family protein [Proteobacteria bacterium]|nr:RcnB family protein [Pseudomonadota bacterium]